MVDCTLSFIMQITSIIAGIIYIVMAFVDLVCWWSVHALCANIFAVILGLACILIEVYIFDFFKYFAFLFTNWGRSVFYLFMAINIVRGGDAWPGWVGFALFIALFIFYLVVFIACRDQKMNTPLAQGGSVRFQTSQSDFS